MFVCPLLWHVSYFTTCFGPHGPSSGISYKNAKRLLYVILSDPLSLHINKGNISNGSDRIAYSSLLAFLYEIPEDGPCGPKHVVK
jgi:hypothetical protein